MLSPVVSKPTPRYLFLSKRFHLFEGQTCIRQMSDEEREFHRLNVECATCDAEE